MDKTSTPNRAIVSLEEKKIGARILCSNLFVENRKVLFFTGFGATQEVRAFAQLLSRGGDLEVKDVEGNGIDKIYGATTENQIWIAKGPEGQSLIYSLPRHTDLIFAPSEEEAREIFNRMLDQKQFVLKDWFPSLFLELPRLIPTVGSMFGCVNMGDIETRIKEGIQSKEFKFPAPAANLTIQRNDAKNKEQVAA